MDAAAPDATAIVRPCLMDPCALHRGFTSRDYRGRMIQRPANRAFPASSGVEPEPDEEPEYEWAALNLPLMRRELAADETDHPLDFIGLGIDPDPQPFENS